MKYILKSSILFALLLGSVFAHAQGIGVSQEQIELEVRPRIVQPLQTVSFELISYNTDLNRARIAHYVDGVLISQQIGKTRYEVDSPAVGGTREVRFVIETLSDGTVTKEYSLTPSQVDLIAEAVDSYAPIMYQGKKLPVHESAVLVSAIPYFVDNAGRKLNPNSLVYSWYVGDQKQVSSSGYGKQTFRFPGSALYRTKTVTVEAETVEGDRVARRSIELPAYDPVVRFYQRNPLWGLDLSQAITSDRELFLEIPELEVESVPYFFPQAQSTNTLNYEWRMNGSVMQTFGDRDIINLRAPDDASGRSRISLKISNSNEILQIAESLFTVVFGQSSTDSDARNTTRTTDSGGPNFFGTGN